MSVQSWNDLGTHPARYFAIHPSGTDPVMFSETGLQCCRELVRILEDLKIPKPLTLLDYGCGTARVLRHFYDYEDITAYGVDIVPEFVEECKKMNLNAETLEEFTEQVDVIFSLTVFIHLNKKNGAKALQYCWDHVKPGGVALLQIPIYDEEVEPETYTHVGVWVESHLRAVAENMGFIVQELRASPGKFDYDNVGVNHGFYQRFKKPN